MNQLATGKSSRFDHLRALFPSALWIDHTSQELPPTSHNDCRTLALYTIIDAHSALAYNSAAETRGSAGIGRQA